MKCFISTSFQSAALLIGIFRTNRVHGHGYLVSSDTTKESLCKFVPGNPLSFSATIDGKELCRGMTFTMPDANMEQFLQCYQSLNFRSYRDLIAAKQKLLDANADRDTGYTRPDEAQSIQVNSTLYWWHPLVGGFLKNHPGPCETWCDDVMVQQDNNCQNTYSSLSKREISPAAVPINSQLCQGKKRLCFYWLTVQFADYQVYINCFNIASLNNGGDPGLRGSVISSNKSSYDTINSTYNAYESKTSGRSSNESQSVLSHDKNSYQAAYNSSSHLPPAMPHALPSSPILSQESSKHHSSSSSNSYLQPVTSSSTTSAYRGHGSYLTKPASRSIKIRKILRLHKRFSS